MIESEGTVDGTGLAWIGSSSSRVGSKFQVDYLPSPNEYAFANNSSSNSVRGTTSSSTTTTSPRTRCDDEIPGSDQIWDPSQAEKKGVLDFVHRYVTPCLKEHAIEVLHKNNYESNGIMKKLESAIPLDGSDWKVEEHDSFLRLMLETDHDVNRVAREMKKSVANCLNVYYKIVHVKSHEVPSGSRRKRKSNDGDPELVEVELKIIKSDVFMSANKRRKRSTREGKHDKQQRVRKSNKTLPGSMPSDVPSENVSASLQLKNASEGDESKVKGISKRQQRMNRRAREQSDISEKDVIEPINSMSDMEAKPSSVDADDAQVASTVIATDTVVATEARPTLNEKNPSAVETEDSKGREAQEQEKNDARTRHTISAQSDGVASTVIVTATAIATEARPTLNEKNPSAVETEDSKSREAQEKNDARTKQTINAQSDGVASTVIVTATAVATDACPTLDVKNPVVAGSEESTDRDSIVKSAIILGTDNADAGKLPLVAIGRHSLVSTAANPQAKNKGGTPISDPSTGQGQHLEKSGSGEDGLRNKAIRGYHTRSTRTGNIMGPSYESDLTLALKIDLEWNANDELDQPCYKSNESLNNPSSRTLRKSKRDALVNDSFNSETRRSSRIKKDNALSAESKPGAKQNPTRAVTDRNKKSGRYSKASTKISSIGSTCKESNESQIKSGPSTVISGPSHSRKSTSRKARETVTSAGASSNSPRKPETLEECHGIVERQSKILARNRLQQQQQPNKRLYDAHPNTGDWFEERFPMLEEYKQTHGHCLVPKIYPANQSLSYWVFRIRSLHKEKMKSKKSRLTDEQIKRLKEIDFQFYVKGADNQLKFEAERRAPKEHARWHSYMKMLREYKEKHGDCLVPKVHAPNQALSTWVFAQRQQKRFYDKKEKSRLTDERVANLEGVGFVWRAKMNKEWQERDRQRKQEMLSESWKILFRKLCAFKQKHGHARVPKNYPTDQPLSSWVFRQRGYHKKFVKEGKKNPLDIEREQKLESIGFEFSVRASPGSRKGNASRSIAYAQQVIENNRNDRAPTDPSNGTRKSRKRRAVSLQEPSKSDLSPLSEEAQNQDTDDPTNSTSMESCENAIARR